ncbi:hypothetical protein PU630_15410 [Microbacterium horticulturae]|uniref:Uncharacterized protein n=1 Tax=Microbacterium horticulturae TaxID=3028316 RepID=A0ABY8BYS2_9MICO|nr:hypothetical protein [Microbacterium sp. KACC 23027]WEG08612.1 hypothetical protein PU630_15410 [Microbacterium sp. KACC 23027]
MIISAIDNSSLLSAQELLRVLGAQFGTDNVKLHTSENRFQINVEVPGEPPFQVVAPNDKQLDSEGTEVQDLQVAVAVRQALPVDAPRIVALQPESYVFVDLTPGITAEEIRTGWRDISEGDF